MASDDTDLLIFAALGLGAWYLYTRSQEMVGQVPVLVGEPQPEPRHVLQLEQPQPSELSPGAEFIGPIANLAQTLVAKLTPIPILGPLAAAGIGTELTAVSEVLGGNLSTGNVITVGAMGAGIAGAGAIGGGLTIGGAAGMVGGILSAPAVLFYLGVGKLLHIDLFGHDLDQVNHILLNAFNSPITHDNVQSGKPIYFLDGDHVLHEVSSALLNKAGFSWRAVIAVDQRVIDFFPHGNPLADMLPPGAKPPTGAEVTTIGYAERPRSADGIRAYFGCDAIFKIGDSNDLYGPGPLLAPGNGDWDMKYGTGRGCPKPLSGSPTEAVQAQIQASAPVAEFLRRARF